MNDFNDYATKAIERCNLKSYYGLAKELGISYPALHRLKNAQSLPSCNTMIKLSKLAGVPEEKALIDLSSWANSDKPEIQKIWLRIAKMIGCFLVFFIFSQTFESKAKLSYYMQSFEYTNYILCDKIKYLFSLLKSMLQLNNLSKLRGAKC